MNKKIEDNCKNITESNELDEEIRLLEIDVKKIKDKQIYGINNVIKKQKVLLELEKKEKRLDMRKRQKKNNKTFEDDILEEMTFEELKKNFLNNDSFWNNNSCKSITNIEELYNWFDKDKNNHWENTYNLEKCSFKRYIYRRSKSFCKGISIKRIHTHYIDESSIILKNNYPSSAYEILNSNTKLQYRLRNKNNIFDTLYKHNSSIEKLDIIKSTSKTFYCEPNFSVYNFFNLENKDVIIIGSKFYSKLNLNNLIDNNFNNLIRMNFSIPNNNNGNKNSIINFFNCTMFDNYVKNIELLFEEKNENNKNLYVKNMSKIYNKKLNIVSIQNFYDYFQKNITNVIYRKNNNTRYFRKFLEKEKIDFEIEEELRCGTGAILDFIKSNIYIIGFSLNSNNIDSNKSYYHKEKYPIQCHNWDNEIELLKILHTKDFIDITFCMLEDNTLPTLNYSSHGITPKINSLSMIIKNYGICVIEDFVTSEILKELAKEFDNMMTKYDNNCLRTNINSEIINENSYPTTNKLFTSAFINDICKKVLDKYYIQNIFIHRDKENIKTNNTYPHFDIDRKLKFYLCLNDMGLENGCFKVLSDSVKISDKQRQIDRSKNVFYPEHPNFNDVIVKVEDMTPVIAKAGTLIIFDTNLVHCGGDNFENGLHREVMRLHVQKLDQNKPSEFW